MKKKVLIYFVLVITIINLSSLGVILYERWKINDLLCVVKEQKVFERVKSEVHLTPMQLKQFQKLRITFHGKLDSLSAIVAKKNELLAVEIKKDDPDTAIINRLVKSTGKIQTESKYLVINHFISITSILSKKQKDKFFNIVLQRFLRKNQLSRPKCIKQEGISGK